MVSSDRKGTAPASDAHLPIPGVATKDVGTAAAVARSGEACRRSSVGEVESCVGSAGGDGSELSGSDCGAGEGVSVHTGGASSVSGSCSSVSQPSGSTSTVGVEKQIQEVWNPALHLVSQAREGEAGEQHPP